MGTEKIIVNKMMVAGSDKRLYAINLTTGGIINGVIPDGRNMVDEARKEVSQYKDHFGIECPGYVLADRLANKYQQHTAYNGYRPVASSLILANHHAMKGFALFMIEPSSSCFQYFGCSSGRGKQMARNEIEKGGFRDLTVEESLPKIAKILLKCQEEMKDKKQELELSILTEGTDFKHKILDRATIDRLTNVAKQEIQGEDVDMQ